MIYAEAVAYMTAAALYGLLSLLSVSGRCSAKSYRQLCSAVVTVQGAAVALRWYYTGHPPILGTFEATAAASWAVIVAAVLVDPKARYAALTMPIAFAICVYGLCFDTIGRPLIISEQSLWVYFHALFAWIAFGFYTISFAAAVAVLARGRLSSRLPGGLASEGAPDKNLERFLLSNSILYGFMAQTVMFVLGSYYSSMLHGGWWNWDAVEYLFVVAWFMYGAVLHGRLFFGWPAERVAVWVVLAYIATLVLYWGLIYFPWSTYHIFDLEFKIHS